MRQSPTDGLVIGYPDIPTRATQPIVGVIDASRSADLFSWISTFAPEAFPLSQSFRVVSLEDWEAGISALSPRSLFEKEAIWPSLILGEIIGQGDREQDISSIPLSRVFASFTYAQARACLLYEKHPPLVKECRSRLSLLEADTTFVKRLISVDELAPMWEVANGNGDVEYLAVLEFVARTVDGGPREGHKPLPAIFEKLGLNQDLITSDSIEQRVLEFERVVVELRTVKQHGFNAALTIAALALLVGRSTTHITLLEEHVHEYPTAVCWFGLLAGMVGQSIWDEKWLRLSTSVERLLRVTTALADPATADLCWIEYSWFRGLRQSSVWIRDTPKLYPRVLSVEILPGVSCQLRLQDGGLSVAKTAPSMHSLQVPASVNTNAASLVGDRNSAAPSQGLNDASAERRKKLISQMKSELARVTETMTKLAHEELQQPELFDSSELVATTAKPAPTRKNKRTPAKGAPKKSA
ncbi:hypothetical protein HI814_00195 [Ralstonia solanacearum]|nr:hypothetical protein HI814_00195 [Ralstonia solanacearum]QKM31279.1 hypothetical protein HI794_00195 [Ralstonia solanacearum]QKM36259.1 hypothetical protein HI793_00195 [Ralstonia solanacearum]